MLLGQTRTYATITAKTLSNFTKNTLDRLLLMPRYSHIILTLIEIYLHLKILIQPRMLYQPLSKQRVAPEQR